METRKTKWGEYNFGEPLLSVERQRSRGTGGLSFCSEIPCSTRRLLFNVSCTQPVCITMYECSKSNGNILLCLKIPVILDLIEFKIFTRRLLKIAFPGFQSSTFYGGAICLKKPVEACTFGARSISRPTCINFLRLFVSLFMPFYREFITPSL